jgi:DNA-binding HxlR family transcriptional regulator
LNTSSFDKGVPVLKKTYALECNIARTLDIIGDKWTLLILRDLMSGITRFNEIKVSLQGISPNILSDRLQQLEQQGIVTSSLYSQHPPRSEYILTDKGWDLRHILNTLAFWGNRHLSPIYREVVAVDCGHQVEFRYHCPTCDERVRDIVYVDARAENENDKKEENPS